jgi:hypothetical protein
MRAENVHGMHGRLDGDNPTLKELQLIDQALQRAAP